MMKAKNIFKTLAFAMLIPAILLTTACSNINNNEEPVKKGFTLPVTVNVTRQGEDATTKATYNESTRKLSFSEGDMLFVNGTHASAGNFAGTLNWTSGGTFSGTIITQNGYSGTADELFTEAKPIYAELLPNGYDLNPGYSYSEIKNSGSYDAYVIHYLINSFALTKAAAVEQLSQECAGSYSSGFALSPQNAILSVTLTGLTKNATGVNISFSSPDDVISGLVNTDGLGHAKFAMGMKPYDLSKCSMRVGVNPIFLIGGEKILEKGHIYNIYRTLNLTMTDAFVDGNETVLSFTCMGESVTMTSKYHEVSGFDAVAIAGRTEVVALFKSASMEKDGNDLKINVTIPIIGKDHSGSMIIDTVSNTYTWSDSMVGSMITLDAITIGGKSIKPLPTPAS